MWKWLVALIVLLLAAGALVARVLTSGQIHTAALSTEPSAATAPATARTARSHDCQAPAAFRPAALTNAKSLHTLDWEPFGREEIGWEIYAPAVQAEIGTDCAPDTPGFAEALALWQKQKPRGLYPTGVFGDTSFQEMRTAWMLRRPFVQATANGAACPAEPPPSALTTAGHEESYEGKRIELRPGTLRAYRRMVDAARREIPGGLSRDQLTIFSGFRSAEADDARCVQEQNCGGPERANCSAHRTGLAVDLYLGAAPGLKPGSSEDSNRLFQARSPLYRWLLRNAGRFGFVGYPFEPWHWEWTGEPVSSGPTASQRSSAAAPPPNKAPTFSAT